MADDWVAAIFAAMVMDGTQQQAGRFKSRSGFQLSTVWGL